MKSQLPLPLLVERAMTTLPTQDRLAYVLERLGAYDYNYVDPGVFEVWCCHAYRHPAGVCPAYGVAADREHDSPCRRLFRVISDTLPPLPEGKGWHKFYAVALLEDLLSTLP